MARDLLRADDGRGAQPAGDGGAFAMAVAPPPRRQERAPGTEPAAPGELVVDDDTAPGAGQLRRRDLMALIRSSVRGAVDRELAVAQRDTNGCPYLDFWLAYYEGQPARQLERAIRRYAPDAGAATSASQLADAVAERAARAAAQWARTGEVSAPDDALGGAAAAPEAPAAPGAMFFDARPGGAAFSAAAPPLAAGRPLEGGTRGRMERALGHDFSAVRIHADDGAARAADGLNANAFTVGTSIGFGAGKYQPDTPMGDALLAHELAHVAQQSAAPAAPAAAAGAALPAGAESDDLEQAADLAAVHAMHALYAPPGAPAEPLPRSAPPRRAGGLLLQRCPSRRPTGAQVPRIETQPYGVYNIIPDSSAALAGANDLTQAQFVQLHQAWTRVNDNSGGLVINGSDPDKATMIAMLGREMGTSRTFRNLIIEITEDSAHIVTINAGRENAFALDEWGTWQVDLEDHEFLDLAAPVGYEWGITQGETILHWLAERRHGAVTGALAAGDFPPAHAAAIAAGGAQENYRRDRSQPGRTVGQDGISPAAGLFEGQWIDDSGNITAWKMDISGASAIPYEVEYRPIAPTAAAPGMSRIMDMEASVHSSAPAPENLFVRFTSATAAVPTPVQAVSGTDIQFASALSGVVPTNGPITVEVVRRTGAVEVVVLTFPWANPFRRGVASAAVDGVTYDLAVRRRRRP